MEANQKLAEEIYNHQFTSIEQEKIESLTSVLIKEGFGILAGSTIKKTENGYTSDQTDKIALVAFENKENKEYKFSYYLIDNRTEFNIIDFNNRIADRFMLDEDQSLLYYIMEILLKKKDSNISYIIHRGYCYRATNVSDDEIILKLLYRD